MILGMNGYIWVQAPSGVKAEESNSMQEDERGEASASMAIYSSKNDDISSTSRLAIDRVAACIRILAANSVTITDSNVNEAYAASMEIREKGGDEIPTEQLFRNDISATILAAVAALE
jgi:exosome complex component RRP4